MGDDFSYTPALECAHCGNKAPMKIVAKYDPNREDSDPSSGFAWSEGDVFELLLCPSCERVSLRSWHYHEMYDPEDWSDSIKYLYPGKAEPVIGLPASVAREYQAALKVTEYPNAYGVLLGRVLQAVCEDRQAKGESLHVRLEDLAKRGEMPKTLADMAQSVRQFRNFGAHAELGELTSAEVPFLDRLCRAVLEYAYSAPKLLEEAQQRLIALESSRRRDSAG